MDAAEKEDLREFLTELYGGQARSWSMNEAIFNLTYELISKSSECTDILRWVPRPIVPGRNAFKQLAADVRRRILRKLRDNKKSYQTCMQGIAYGMRRDFDLAAQGL